MSDPKPLDPKAYNYERKLKKFKSSDKAPQNRNAKSELKSIDQIRKARDLKEKRRAKTGRHWKAKQRGKGGKRK